MEFSVWQKDKCPSEAHHLTSHSELSDSNLFMLIYSNNKFLGIKSSTCLDDELKGGISVIGSVKYKHKKFCINLVNRYLNICVHFLQELIYNKIWSKCATAFFRKCQRCCFHTWEDFFCFLHDLGRIFTHFCSGIALIS